MQPDDLGSSSEGAEHEYDATILADMGDGFDSAAGQVHIRNFSRIENSEGVHALGGAIQQALRGDRGRCNKEHTLLTDPLDQLRRKLLDSPPQDFAYNSQI